MPCKLQQQSYAFNPRARVANSLGKFGEIWSRIQIVFFCLADSGLEVVSEFIVSVLANRLSNEC